VRLALRKCEPDQPLRHSKHLGNSCGHALGPHIGTARLEAAKKDLGRSEEARGFHDRTDRSTESNCGIV
jgi:hypothetical protein